MQLCSYMYSEKYILAKSITRELSKLSYIPKVSDMPMTKKSKQYF